MNKLKIYCWLLVALGLIWHFIGVAMVCVVPYIAADALEDAIRGAQTSE